MAGEDFVNQKTQVQAGRSQAARWPHTKRESVYEKQKREEDEQDVEKRKEEMGRKICEKAADSQSHKARHRTL